MGSTHQANSHTNFNFGGLFGPEMSAGGTQADIPGMSPMKFDHGQGGMYGQRGAAHMLHNTAAAMNLNSLLAAQHGFEPGRGMHGHGQMGMVMSMPHAHAGFPGMPPINFTGLHDH